MHRQDCEPNHFPYLELLFGTALIASTLAFTKPVRRKIWKRDGGKCCLCGAVGSCECAHITHDRNDPRYNDESNGRLLCTPDHYLDHINREDRNGLSKNHNAYAKHSLWQRLNDKQKEKLPPPE